MCVRIFSAHVCKCTRGVNARGQPHGHDPCGLGLLSAGIIDGVSCSPGIYVGAGNPNTGPQPCMAKALSAEPSPHSLCCPAFIFYMGSGIHLGPCALMTKLHPNSPPFLFFFHLLTPSTSPCFYSGFVFAALIKCSDTSSCTGGRIYWSYSRCGLTLSGQKLELATSAVKSRGECIHACVVFLLHSPGPREWCCPLEARSSHIN